MNRNVISEQADLLIGAFCLGFSFAVILYFAVQVGKGIAEGRL